MIVQDTRVTQWFHSQAAYFYNTGIQTLVPQYDKCLNSGGEYVGEIVQNLL